jgi:multidrug efflux system membrane fusion protein
MNSDVQFASKYIMRMSLLRQPYPQSVAVASFWPNQANFPAPRRAALDFPACKLRVGALLLALTACLVTLGCSSADPKPAGRHGAGAAGQTVPVGVANAQVADVPVYLNGLGSVTAYYTDSVKTRVDGELVQVNFKEGQHVNKGDLLAVIDPRPYQVALDQAQATLFKDQASLRDAKLNYQRYKGLLQDSGSMSQQQVDTQAATVDQLEGTVRTDQAAVNNAKLNLTYCHITAPINGRVGLRQVDPGNMVHAADTTPLLVITQLQPIAVLFTLPEAHEEGYAYGRSLQP